ncbi:hypothetical protein [Erwinia mallotivora]|uniref:hypothetical protein n=1 Tax=Erwinia mallotivora TaxID=69222 RepID=UPI0027E1FCFB|nr:hypothetical protein [Erwinia mallotivora]
MIYRFTLAALTAAITLTGCAKHSAEDTAEQDYATGPSQVTVSHVVSRTDDGSSIIVTVDGKDAGPLVRGETTDLHMLPGKHKVGGYVSTLYGYGRVTIQPVEIAAVPDKVKHITYSVLKNKPTFTETAATPVPRPVKKAAAPADSSKAPAATSETTPSSTTTASASTGTATPSASSSTTTANASTGTSTSATNTSSGTATTSDASATSAKTTTGTAASTDSSTSATNTTSGTATTSDASATAAKTTTGTAASTDSSSSATNTTSGTATTTDSSTSATGN